MFFICCFLSRLHLHYYAPSNPQFLNWFLYLPYHLCFVAAGTRAFGWRGRAVVVVHVHLHTFLRSARTFCSAPHLPGCVDLPTPAGWWWFPLRCCYHTAYPAGDLLSTPAPGYPTACTIVWIGLLLVSLAAWRQRQRLTGVVVGRRDNHAAYGGACGLPRTTCSARRILAYAAV